MRYTLASAALLASASIVLAAPAAEDITKRSTFTVEQSPAAKYVYKNGALQSMKTFNKYAKHGAVAPESLKTAAANAQQEYSAQIAATGSQSGAVTANPEQYDEAYLCAVTAGDQTFQLDFDTGSSDLWVFSVYLPQYEQGSHTLYSPSSSAASLSGETWQISYGDGSGASGIVFSDKVVVGPVTATSQAVEAATSVSSEFQQDPADGLLGLAFDSINTVSPNKVPTFFDTVKPTLAKPLFAANLRKGTAGSYDFGFIDTTKYTGSITYVNVDNSQGFWGFTAGGYSTGSNAVGTTSIGSAIADTGTTLLYIPAAAAKAYYSKVSGSSNSAAYGGYVAPCSATWPNWNVKIGGTTFTVPGSYINYAPVTTGSSTCFGGIQSNTGIGLTIFGDIFLKSKYVIFDETYSTPRLGFANQA